MRKMSTMKSMVASAAPHVELLESRQLLSAGSLNTAFGGTGIVTTPAYDLETNGGSPGFGNVAPLANGGMLFAGSAIIPINNPTTKSTSMTELVEMNGNGTPNTAFGNDGVATYQLYDAGDLIGIEVDQVAVESNGKIVVTGAAFDENATNPKLQGTKFVVERFNSNGTIDTSFNPQTLLNYSTGKSGAAEGDYPDGAVVLADGNVIVAGASTGGRNTNTLVVELNSDGSFDTSFGFSNSGTRLLQAQNYTSGLAVDGQGRILLATATAPDYSTDPYSGSQIGLERLTAAGSVDTSFGTNGEAVSDAFPGVVTVLGIGVQANGTIVVGGNELVGENQSNGGTAYVTVTAFNSNGSVDNAYGESSNGTNGNLTVQDGTAYTMQPDGESLLLSNYSTYDGNTGEVTTNFEITRFTATGALDLSLNGNGNVKTDIPGTIGSSAVSLAFAPDNSGGKIDVMIYSPYIYPGGIVAAQLTDDVGGGSTSPTELTGTIIGTAGSYQNDGNTISKAFDGILTNYFDGPTANGDYAGLNLGSPKNITEIGYDPRAGFSSRMVGGEFQVSNSADFSNALTIYTITSAPASDTLTTVQILTASAYQYIRYFAPNGSYGDVGELAFYGTTPTTPTAPTKLSGSAIGTPGSYRNQGATIANVFDGNLSTFFDAPDASGDWVGLDLGTAQVVTQVKYAPRSGYESRMVGGEIQASNTADFSSGVVTLYTITSTPAAGVLTTQSISNTTAYRYYRYLSPTNGDCNIAELEFDG